MRAGGRGGGIRNIIDKEKNKAFQEVSIAPGSKEHHLKIDLLDVKILDIRFKAKDYQATTHSPRETR